MFTMLIKWLIYAMAVFAVGQLLPGIHVPDFTTALIAAAVLGIVNVLIKPVLRFLTFPINLITLGIFGLVLNTLLFWSATLFVHAFMIDGFWWAAAGAFVVSFVSAIGNRIVLGSDGKVGSSEET